MKLLSNPNYTPDYKETPEYAYRLIRFIWDIDDIGEYRLYE